MKTTKNSLFCIHQVVINNNENVHEYVLHHQLDQNMRYHYHTKTIWSSCTQTQVLANKSPFSQPKLRPVNYDQMFPRTNDSGH